MWKIVHHWQFNFRQLPPFKLLLTLFIRISRAGKASTHYNLDVLQLNVVHPPGDDCRRVAARGLALQLLNFGRFQVRRPRDDFHFLRFHCFFVCFFHVKEKNYCNEEYN